MSKKKQAAPKQAPAEHTAEEIMESWKNIPQPAPKPAKVKKAKAPVPAPAAEEPVAAPAPVPPPAPAPKAKPKPAGPVGVAPNVRGRPYWAAVVIKRHGLEAGATDEMAAEVDALSGKPNFKESLAWLKVAWQCVNGYVNG